MTSSISARCLLINSRPFGPLAFHQRYRPSSLKSHSLRSLSFIPLRLLPRAILGLQPARPTQIALGYLHLVTPHAPHGGIRRAVGARLAAGFDDRTLEGLALAAVLVLQPPVHHAPSLSRAQTC